MMRRRPLFLSMGALAVLLGAGLGFRAMVVVAGGIPVSQEDLEAFARSRPALRRCFPGGIPPPTGSSVRVRELVWDDFEPRRWTRWAAATSAGLTWPAPPGASVPLIDQGQPVVELWLIFRKMGPWEWVEGGLLATHDIAGPTGFVDFSHEAEAWFLKGERP